jgi:hypothetical protein
MASPLIVIIAFVVASLAFTVMGLAVARWLNPAWAPAAGIAPALGWGLFSAVSLPAQTVVGFNGASTALCAGLAIAAGAFGLLRRRPAPAEAGARLPPWAYGVAAAVALIPLAALLPKLADGGVIIGTTAFDHSKIAIVDEITRLGLPAGNPFFGAQGARSSLAYYYLWHFSAAQVSAVLHISGWEADAAMVGFTAYASLLLMMSLAAGLCASEAPPGRIRRRIGVAVGLVALLSLTGSLRQLMVLLIGWDGVHALLSTYTGLAGWMVQASWVPQHMQSACCVVLAVLMLIDLASRPRPGAVLIVAALAASGFGGSAWVGGVTFALCAAGAGLVGLLTAKDPRTRLGFVVAALCAAVLAIALSLPMLLAEFGTLGSRRGGSPIALHPYEVLGHWAPAGLRRLMDLPAYWLVLLPVELLAIYPVGMAALILHLRRARGPSALGLAVLTIVSLATAWLLISTIGNNDLGWRAILPAVLVLTALTAASMARWFDQRAWVPLGGAAILALLCGLDRQIFQNLHGRSTKDAPDFAQSPAMWAAVRQYAGPEDRVANNPQYLDDLTDWPVNPSWALLANRPSCFSGWETARAYVALPTVRLQALEDQFERVFDGDGSAADVRQMAEDYGCRVVLLVPSDGAWDNDPFAGAPEYRLVETKPDRWRIYVAHGQPPASAPAR